MAKPLEVTEILARNLKALLEDHPILNSQNALAQKAKVAQTSIGYMLRPERRQISKSGKLSSPTLDNIEKVAKAFGKEAWQLLYPDPGTAPLNHTERQMYDKLMRSVQDLREITQPGVKTVRK